MQDGTLGTPDRGALWLELALTNTQLARLCDLTTRQIIHWTNQGYIAPSRERPVRYNGQAIDLCILIKQGLDHGMPLKRAVAAARRHLSAEGAQRHEFAPVEPPTLNDLHERLRGAEAAIEAVCRQIAPLVPPAARERSDREGSVTA